MGLLAGIGNCSRRRWSPGVSRLAAQPLVVTAERAEEGREQLDDFNAAFAAAWNVHRICARRAPRDIFLWSISRVRWWSRCVEYRVQHPIHTTSTSPSVPSKQRKV